MATEPARHSGRLIPRRSVPRTTEVDCSAWGDNRASGKWTAGRFVARSVTRSPVEADCSEWGTLGLRLTMKPSATVKPLALALDMTKVLKAVDDLDRQLGGDGFDMNGEDVHDGEVTVTLTPRRRAEAQRRIEQIAETVQRAEPDSLAVTATKVT